MTWTGAHLLVEDRIFNDNLLTEKSMGIMLSQQLLVLNPRFTLSSILFFLRLHLKGQS